MVRDPFFVTRPVCPRMVDQTLRSAAPARKAPQLAVEDSPAGEARWCSRRSERGWRHRGSGSRSRGSAHFLKPLARLSAREIYISIPFPIQVKLDMVSILNFTRHFADGQNTLANVPDTNDFDFPLCPSEFNLDVSPELPFIKRALVKCLPGVQWADDLRNRTRPPPSFFICSPRRARRSVAIPR